ncbi:DUF4313 domain-containing protein [Alteromonas sp. KUL42]|nr:DUF4313 domain-containing protein [Alteromonas sp. KUL42]
MSQKYKMNSNQTVIHAMTEEGEPFATVSKCLPESHIINGENIVDEPNMPGILDVLVCHNIVVDTGRFIQMGFNQYPVVKMCEL